MDNYNDGHQICFTFQHPFNITSLFAHFAASIFCQGFKGRVSQDLVIELIANNFSVVHIHTAESQVPGCQAMAEWAAAQSRTPAYVDVQVCHMLHALYS